MQARGRDENYYDEDGGAKGMRILVCGSRYWTDKEFIRKVLAELPEGSTIIHGDCRGADRLAGEVAKELGLQVIAYPAQWKLGAKAGPIRNKQMLVEEEPDFVLAFHDDLTHARGTRDMLRRADKAGISYRVWSHYGLVEVIYPDTREVKECPSV